MCIRDRHTRLHVHVSMHPCILRGNSPRQFARHTTRVHHISWQSARVCGTGKGNQLSRKFGSSGISASSKTLRAGANLSVAWAQTQVQLLGVGNLHARSLPRASLYAGCSKKNNQRGVGGVILVTAARQAERSGAGQHGSILAGHVQSRSIARSARKLN